MCVCWADCALTCHCVEVHDKGYQQESFGCDQTGDEDEGDPEGVIGADDPEAAKDSKHNPQQEDDKQKDVGIGCASADSQIHMGCKDVKIKIFFFFQFYIMFLKAAHEAFLS